MLGKRGLFIFACGLICSCGEVPNEALIAPTASISTIKRQSLSIASNPTLQGGATDLTIFAWVNLASKTTNEVFASKDNDQTKAGSEYWLGYELSSDRLNFQVEDPKGGTKFVKSNTLGSPPTGQWMFVVGWFDHIGKTVNIQVNNAPSDQAPAGTTTRVTNTIFAIGSDINVGSFLDGQISSVGFFKRQLSARERTFLYNYGPPPGLLYDQLPENLQVESRSTFVSWWDLTETSGLRHDSRKTGNNLTPTLDGVQ